MFPKDVKALTHTAKTQEYQLRILESVDEVNRSQKQIVLKKVRAHFGEDGLKGKRIAVWGSHSSHAQMTCVRHRIDLIHGLIESGASVIGFDPESMQNAREVMPEALEYADDHFEAVKGRRPLHLYRVEPFSKT